VPFTEKPMKMVEFGGRAGIPYIFLKFEDQEQEWRWNFKSEEFDLALQDGKKVA